MKKPVKVSIIITSYNYGRFLPASIDSALAQTYPHTEVIVVDDGSKDESAAVIQSYGNYIIPILKENGGQASAFNAGFRLCNGDLICFMDSDDLLLPTAIDKAVELFCSQDIAKVHWPLWFIDEYGRKNGDGMHLHNLAEGDLRDVVVRDGPHGYNWPSTSGNAWSRSFLEKIFPMPEVEYRIGPDIYLSALAPFFGLVRKVSDPQGCYRLHGKNNTCSKPFEIRVQEALYFWNHCFDMLSDYCMRLGLKPDVKNWKASSWWHQMELMIQEIKAVVPEGETFILADEDQCVIGHTLVGRHCIPFLERDRQYWGRPADDSVAIRELERLRQCGASFLIFAMPAFWWLEYYSDLHSHLRSTFRCTLENKRLVIFDLR